MTDKRGVQEPSAGDAVQEPPTDDGTLHGRHTEHESGGAPNGESNEAHLSEPASLQQGPSSSGGGEQPEPENDFLDDLKRLQADFDNYRKRMMRESAEASDRATAGVIEDLLPVLDNFERAIAHGEGGEGVQLVFKDFTAALERLGLSEVPAEGAAFDPNVHEAVESRETEGLEEPTIIEVYRRGYMHKDRLIRPAMVVVGRPADKEEG